MSTLKRISNLKREHSQFRGLQMNIVVRFYAIILINCHKPALFIWRLVLAGVDNKSGR